MTIQCEQACLYYICMMYKPTTIHFVDTFIHLALLYKSQLPSLHAALAHATFYSPLPFPSLPPKPCVQIFIHASIASMGATKHSHEIKNMQSLRNISNKRGGRERIYFVSHTGTALLHLSFHLYSSWI